MHRDSLSRSASSSAMRPSSVLRHDWERSLPVVLVGGPRLGEFLERLPYLLQRESEDLSGADDRNAPQSLPRVPALAARRSL